MLTTLSLALTTILVISVEARAARPRKLIWPWISDSWVQSPYSIHPPPTTSPPDTIYPSTYPFMGCFNVEEDVDYEGNDLNDGRQFVQPTREHCAEACEKNARCITWTYDIRYGRRWCWLKHTRANRRYLPGSWSGQCQADESIYGVDGTCYVDDETRILQHFLQDQDEANTPSKCVAECGSLGYPLAGVQYSYQCFCGHRLTNRARLAPSTDCSTPCSGDESVFCGGTWRMNVYSTRTSNTPATSNCGPGWRHFSGKCYKVVHRNVDWYTARSSCQSLGAQLASVGSQEENEFIKSLHPAGVDNDFWLGAAADLTREGTFFWVDGTAWTYQNWYPDGHDGGERCVGMYRDGLWNDHPCTVPWMPAFVCKK